jgi:5-methylcytosine-specific restriction endonuclease McrA
MASKRPDLNKSRWQTMRKQARMRDGNRCRNCGATAKLSVHHIVKARKGGRDTLDNLVTLCASCHRKADAKPKAGFLQEGVTSRASGENTSPIHPFKPHPDDLYPNRPQSRQWGATPVD